MNVDKLIWRRILEEQARAQESVQSSDTDEAETPPPLDIGSRQECESNEELPKFDYANRGNRYYLHHHAPNHRKSLPGLGSFGNPMHLMHKRNDHTTKVPPKVDVERPCGVRLVKSGANLLGKSFSHLWPGDKSNNSKELDLHAGLRVVSDHELASATCSRYWGCCEYCRKTVHTTKYLYCRNCPAVYHNSASCLRQSSRYCPFREIQVRGWGEGRCAKVFGRGDVIDTEFIYLGGSQSTQSNECAECGRIYDPELGHNVNNETTTKKSCKFYRVLLPTHQTSHKKRMAKQILACHYTGRYYCKYCHWGDEWYIPGLIFLFNDYTKHPVCRSSYLKLQIVWNTIFLNVPKYWLADFNGPEEVYNVRKRLKKMTLYFDICSDVLNLLELLTEGNYSYMIYEPSVFTMADAVDIYQDRLLPLLKKTFNLLLSHISKCQMCRSVNQRCCICQSSKVMFSFDEDVGQCSTCHGIYHLKCSFSENYCKNCLTNIQNANS